MASLERPLSEARAVAIVGPTASGKSALAIEACQRIGGEVISCDSVQVYRGLDIGSGKAALSERSLIPHHLIDIVEIDDDMNAGRFADAAADSIAKIAMRGRVPVIVGGTGLYLTALFNGLFEGGESDPALRARLNRLAEKRGSPRLHRLLQRRDPQYASRTQPKDRVRVVRALEVSFQTKGPFSDAQRARKPAFSGPRLIVGLSPAREELRHHVQRRTRSMIEKGLVEEVESVLARAPAGGPVPRPLLAIGYRETVEALASGGVDIAPDGKLERAIVISTMQYAKRQMTYFKRQFDVEWFEDSRAALSRIEAWASAR